MHKQSFAECHSLATKAPLTRPSMHFSSKIPEVSKKNFWSFQLKPQEFKQKTPLEAEFHVRRSTVTGILKGMEKKGLIQRLSVEEDARLKRIILTPQAKSLHREVEMAVVRMEKIALRGLSEAEIEVFLEILEKMKANLQEDMLTYDEQKGE